MVRFVFVVSLAVVALGSVACCTDGTCISNLRADPVRTLSA